MANNLGENGEKKCDLCGKLIYRVYWDNYLYKIKLQKDPIKYYCSYTCYRKAGGDNGEQRRRIIKK